MKSLLSRKLVIVAVLVAIAAGAGVAVAATQSGGGSQRQAYLDDVAKRLNVSPSALRAAMKAALNDRIDAAVAAGRLTQAQANMLKQRIAQGGGAPFFAHRFGFGPHAGFGPGRMGPGGLGLGAAVVQYLGVSPATLRSDLASGKTLAQVASSTPGKSVAGLKTALTAQVKARLDKAVAAGFITSAEEQQRLENLPAKLDAALQHNWIAGPFAGPRFRGPGFAGPRPRLFGP